VASVSVAGFEEQLAREILQSERTRMLNKTYGSQLLVSAEVLSAAGESDHGGESLGAVQVKGRDEPIEIYRLA
jgi:class 3 adenylate cyclase